MRRVITALVLALCLLGCASAPSPAPSLAPLRMTGDIIGTTCAAETYIVGVIVADPQSGEAAIQDDRGVVTPLIWGMHNTAAVAMGRRYKIGGQIAYWLAGERRLWACAGADAVTPQ